VAGPQRPGSHLPLAGIYGPGRSLFDALRAGTAKRIDKPGQVFSRIHVEDLARVLIASIERPHPGAVYNVCDDNVCDDNVCDDNVCDDNVCDDDPAPAEGVVTYAAGLLGIAVPPLVPLDAAGLSPMALSFYDDNKRVSNRLIKTGLGVRLRYPDFRASLADETCRNPRPSASSAHEAGPV
jgi:hypothetical protein